MEKLIKSLHGIEEFLRAGKHNARLFISRKNSRINALKEAAEKTGMEIVNIPPSELNKRFGEENRGVVLQVYGGGEEDRKGSRKKNAGTASADAPPTGFEQQVDQLSGETEVVLILDGVTDPHNYGAILRSADQFGVSLVVSRTRRSAGDTDTVARTSSGAVNFVNTAVVKNLSRAVEYLKTKGFWIYSADMGGEPVNKTNLKGRTAVIMGSEGKGVSRLLAEKSDGIISIPSKGNIDSLNVSVAAGVILYEIIRQNS